MPDVWIMVLISQLLLLVANISDLRTTTVALRVRGTYETNPLMRWAMASFGRLWFIFKLALTHGATLLLATAMPLVSVVITVAGAALILTVAANNYRIAEGKAAWWGVFR